jgi:anti-sigma B factor antagonist
MSLSITKRRDTVIVGIEQQLGVRNRQELRATVLRELERGERTFVLDFSATSHVDSSGLGVLVSLARKVRESGGEIRLANLSAELATLFELTRLDTLFPVEDDREGGVGHAPRG